MSAPHEWEPPAHNQPARRQLHPAPQRSVASVISLVIAVFLLGLSAVASIALALLGKFLYIDGCDSTSSCSPTLSLFSLVTAFIVPGAILGLLMWAYHKSTTPFRPDGSPRDPMPAWLLWIAFFCNIGWLFVLVALLRASIGP